MQVTPGHLYEGQLTANGLRFAIVCARFNDFFVARLLEGALDRIARCGGDPAAVSVAWVPGAFEIPVVARRFAASGKVDAVIALGAVITGATSHADHINSSIASGLAGIMSDTGIPVVYAVITAESLDQAMERSGTKLGNRGADAAGTAMEMANLLRAIDAGLKA